MRSIFIGILVGFVIGVAESFMFKANASTAQLIITDVSIACLVIGAVLGWLQPRIQVAIGLLLARLFLGAIIYVAVIDRTNIWDDLGTGAINGLVIGLITALISGKR